MSGIRNIIKSFKRQDSLWSINRIWWREEAEAAFSVEYIFSTDEFYTPYAVYDHFNREIVARFETEEPAQDLKNKLVNRYIMFKVMEAKKVRDRYNPKKR